MAEQGSQGSMGESLVDQAPQQKAVRLCYVDDSRTAAFVLQRLLKPYAYQIDYFQSAEPAFVALMREDYDLLLTDLKVSSQGMDGDELIHTLRQHGHPKVSQIPVIVITGTTDESLVEKVYAAGANQVMSKPVDGEELDGHIRRLLEARPKPERPVLHQVSNVAKPEPDSSSIAPPAKPAVVDVIAPQAEPVADDVPTLKAETAPPDSPSQPDIVPPKPVIPEPVLEDEFASEDEVIIDSGGPSRGHAQATRTLFDSSEDELSDLDQYILDSSRKSSGRSPLVKVLLGFIAVILIVWVGKFAWQNLFDKGVPVQTVPAQVGEIYHSLVASGQVASKQRVEIAPSHEGRLVKVLVDEGEKVAAGQVLAQLDDRELLTHLKRVQADLANAREDISLSNRTLERLRSANEKGVVAKRFVEDAEMRLRSARTRAGVAMEQVHNAMLDLENQKITAPFAGIITKRSAEIGQWVTPAQTLFSLADDSQREIEVSVDAVDSSMIEVGQLAVVSSDVAGGQHWEESVVRIGTAAEREPNSNSVKVYLSLGDKAPELRFGQQIDAEIRTAWNPKAIKIPFEALINREGQLYAAVFANGIVNMHQVQVGIEDYSMIEVKRGLQAGEEVILSKGRFLQDGDKVFLAQSHQ